MAVIVGDGRLTLTGYVGEHIEIDGDVWLDGFTHPQVLAALSEIEEAADLTVHINSGGGLAYEGAAIRSALAEREGRTDVVIDGIAASAASLIAMVGETISMAEGASMMIHDPSGLTIGTVADHEATIRGLNSLATSYARVYARRSGKTEEDARDIMKAETWYAAEEAVEAGFADEVLGTVAGAVAAFPYQEYARAPRDLVAQAKEQGWRFPAARPAVATATKAAPPATTSPKETPMTDKERADQLAAELEALKASNTTSASDAVKADRERRAAVLALDEAKGREALAEHLYASTDMNVDTIKATLAAAPKAEEQQPDPAADYETQRTATAGAGLGGDPKPKAKGDVSVLKSAAERRNARSKR